MSQTLCIIYRHLTYENNYHLQALNFAIRWLLVRFGDPPMYVCLCNGFTDREVRRAAKSGVCSARDIYSLLGATPQCGKCIPAVESILRELGEPYSEWSVPPLPA
jgi:bacterioferritin-associated ferredoxin